MATKSLGEIRSLWEEAKGSWEGLREALRDRVERAEGTNSSLITQLQQIATAMEGRGEKLPSSPRELLKMVKEKTPAMSEPENE